jgi:Mg2+/Co2+ transporter CorC
VLRLAALESAHEDVETLGGLAMAIQDRLPALGAEVFIGDRVLRVEQLDGRRVARRRLLAAPGTVTEVAVASSPGSLTT